LTSKPIIASVVLAVVCAGGAVALTGHQTPATPRTAQAADTTAGARTVAAADSPSTPVAATSPAASRSATRLLSTPSAIATKPSPSPSAAAVVTGPVYGQTVDTVDAAPNAFTKPGPLPKRPETVPLTVAGNYSTPWPGSLGGKYLMFWNGQHVTITGKGYFRIRYEIAWFNRVGQMVMPT
jgi:hypothetical protein